MIANSTCLALELLVGYRCLCFSPTKLFIAWDLPEAQAPHDTPAAKLHCETLTGAFSDNDVQTLVSDSSIASCNTKQQRLALDEKINVELPVLGCTLVRLQKIWKPTWLLLPVRHAESARVIPEVIIQHAAATDQTKVHLPIEDEVSSHERFQGLVLICCRDITS